MTADLLPADPDLALATSFRDAMSELVARLAVVTGRDAAGRPLGLLVSSLCSYSVRPPSVLVSVDRSSRSCLPLTRGDRFGVHLLDAGQAAVAGAFATRGVVDKFARQQWRWDGDVPRLAAAPVFLLCSRAATLPHGDHVVLIGEVTRVEARPATPLVHYQRGCAWELRPA